MTCIKDRCDSEKFSLIRIYRNMRRIDGRWVFSADIDTRRVACDICGTQYLTETKISAELTHQNYRRYEKPIDAPEQLHLFD